MAMTISAAFLNNSSSRWEAVWDAWEDRDGTGGYRQGTPAGMAMQRGLDKVAELIEGWKYN